MDVIDRKLKHNSFLGCRAQPERRGIVPYLIGMLLLILGCINHLPQLVQDERLRVLMPVSEYVELDVTNALLPTLKSSGVGDLILFGQGSC